MSDQYQWWRDALAGKSPPISADHPQSGFFKMRDGKGGKWLPVAIWRTETAFNCRVGQETRNPSDVWTFCAGNPVGKTDAQHAFELGRWPADVGDNSGDLSLADEITDACEQALSWLKATGVTDKTSMDTAANWRAKLQELSKKADKERDDKVRPHLTAQREINAEYKPLVDRADSAAKSLRDALSRYMAAEEEKARKAAAEAARIENEKRMDDYRRQRDADEAARGSSTVDAEIDAAGDLPVMVAPVPVKLQAGGQRGKKASLREITRYQISNYAAALAHVKDHPDVLAAVEKVAFAQARAGAVVPGVSSFVEKVAV